MTLESWFIQKNILECFFGSNVCTKTLVATGSVLTIFYILKVSGIRSVVKVALVHLCMYMCKPFTETEAKLETETEALYVQRC